MKTLRFYRRVLLDAHQEESIVRTIRRVPLHHSQNIILFVVLPTTIDQSPLPK